ncbi:acyl-CoA dehydrogenase family protein [Paenibacillus sp. MMS18-CY102]|uniref:acyl-CoA dehydrogenase family protein n=1 Tax=Paenibacillus sp. MMS18-CY102 TaxID=2682849 RepID=UPI00136605AD|nr:acyl-CoA dehydrogenase family protein [Paenibacillus sp. MMS18-CY102]MWC28000.1 acyl-CoA dehydrogenase [Paenibacillus sp. MMS18-CY102]
MRFQLAEEVEMTRSVLREFAREKVALGAIARDEAQALDFTIFRQMGELGLTGILFPERYGGAGGDTITYTAVLEELAKVCASTAAILAMHTAYAAWPIYQFGNSRLREEMLVPLAQGTQLGGAGLANVSQRMEDGALAKPLLADEREGHIRLQGTHPLVLFGGHADVYVLAARLASTGKTNVFVLLNGTAGLQVNPPMSKLGLRSMPMSAVVLQGCEIPIEQRLGKSSRGPTGATSKMALLGQLSAAAISVGIAQGALEEAAAYAKARKQFGVTISRQQGILFKLADMSVRTDAARLLVYDAAWRLDTGLEAVRACAIARRYAAEAAVAVTTEAVQVLGGYGYMREYQLERYMRDAKCMESELGLGGMVVNEDARILSQ